MGREVICPIIQSEYIIQHQRFLIINNFTLIIQLKLILLIIFTYLDLDPKSYMKAKRVALQPREREVSPSSSKPLFGTGVYWCPLHKQHVFW